MATFMKSFRKLYNVLKKYFSDLHQLLILAVLQDVAAELQQFGVLAPQRTIDQPVQFLFADVLHIPLIGAQVDS